jgi:phosphopantetheine adenylyltransferase
VGRATHRFVLCLFLVFFFLCCGCAHNNCLIERNAEFVRYVHTINPFIRVDMHPLHDPFGPSTVRPTLGAVVVSHETKSGGEKINAVRKANGLKEVELIVVELVQRSGASDTVCGGGELSLIRLCVGVLMCSSEEAAATDVAAKVSSTEIRRALYDAHERTRAKLQTQWTTLALVCGGESTPPSLSPANTAHHCLLLCCVVLWLRRLVPARLKPLIGGPHSALATLSRSAPITRSLTSLTCSVWSSSIRAASATTRMWRSPRGFTTSFMNRNAMTTKRPAVTCGVNSPEKSKW